MARDDAASVEPPTAKAAPDTTPASDGAPAAQPTPDTEQEETFAVTFQGDPEIVERMVVRCHKGGVVEGDEEVHIARAGRGPCRVEGFGNGKQMSVSAILKGPRTYTCFRGGARICE